MLLRKQSSYNEIFSAKLNFDPSRVGYEAGVTLWWNQYSHAAIGLTAVGEEDEERTTVVIREPTGRNGEIKVKCPP
jgi:hypothetical protein